MRRRDFVAATGGAMAWPVAANAQQAGKLPTIGFLGADPTLFAPWTAAFVARLRELGWIDGRTIAIEYRWSEGRTERYAEIAAEFVSKKVDVIVTVGSAVPTVRQATATIPIVFAVAIDPERSGLVSSLAQPGGNVTGLSLQAANLAGKRLEVLRELIPRLRRLAIIFNGGNGQTVLEMNDTAVAARELKLDILFSKYGACRTLLPYSRSSIPRRMRSMSWSTSSSSPIIIAFLPSRSALDCRWSTVPVISSAPED